MNLQHVLYCPCPIQTQADYVFGAQLLTVWHSMLGISDQVEIYSNAKVDFCGTHCLVLRLGRIEQDP